MRYYVYILLCKDKRLYIGYSSDLKTRIRNHSLGKVMSTKRRLPFKLIHYEFFVNRIDAKAREKFLKSGAGHTQIKSFLKRTLA